MTSLLLRVGVSLTASNSGKVGHYAPPPMAIDGVVQYLLAVEESDHSA